MQTSLAKFRLLLTLRPIFRETIHSQPNTHTGHFLALNLNEWSDGDSLFGCGTEFHWCDALMEKTARLHVEFAVSPNCASRNSVCCGFGLTQQSPHTIRCTLLTFRRISFWLFSCFLWDARRCSIRVNEKNSLPVKTLVNYSSRFSLPHRPWLGLGQWSCNFTSKITNGIDGITFTEVKAEK